MIFKVFTFFDYLMFSFFLFFLFFVFVFFVPLFFDIFLLSFNTLKKRVVLKFHKKKIRICGDRD